MKRGYLLLEDGTRLEGESFGYETSVSGEVVFTTSMVGYPETLTDPSYFGQILVFTYPLMGNYGVPDALPFAQKCLANFESDRIWVRGVVVAEYIDTPSHFSSTHTLGDWLTSAKIPGLTGIDTRALTQKIREKGVMRGQIFFDKDEKKDFIDINAQNLVDKVSIKQPIIYPTKKKSSQKPVLLFDCGVKHGIIRELIKRDIPLHRVPWDWQPANYEDFSGVIISNGPGDPVKVGRTIETVQKFLRLSKPVFGICLGNQILALAAGGKTYKLKYGHRSSNQPAKDLMTNRSYITTHNHGFAVDMSTLSDEWQEWFVNLNDGTNEGIRHKSKPFFTVQFHAEANPGPTDTTYLFDYFEKEINKY